MNTARWIDKAETGLSTLYRQRQLVALGAYGGIAAFAYAATFLLHFDFRIPADAAVVFRTTLPILILLRILSNWMMGVSAGHWRFVGTHDITRLVAASTLGTVFFYALTAWLPFVPDVSRSIIVIEWVFSTYVTAALWIVYRMLREQLRHLRSGVNGGAKRVLIIGAGEAGSLLAREMTRHPTGYRPIGFIDDDPIKLRTTLHGFAVLGSTRDLETIVAREQVDEIAIAIPSATPAELRNVVERCEATNLRFKVLPGIADVVAGDVRLNQLRELRIEDLLGREPVQLELPELFDDLRGRSVLITGAAGSIGAELARQVAIHEPGILVLFDQAETPMFYLERELKEKHPERQMVFVVGDVVDPLAVQRVFHDFAPSRVYHAAAYKHVAMMQTNVREAVRNNVLGTYLVASAAGEGEVEKFVLVSTDKAVKPTSIMGATKRLAELAVLELQNKYPATTFAAVRFGNVLGSNGSVIPLFKEQIDAGRPLTVTHPEVTRYFMTIPEAVHLILQASLLPEMHGRIAMLEMGDPIRIVDLAKNLLRLYGLPHENNSRLVFTGLRWGEKLHEELVAPDEVTTPTSITKVRLVGPSRVTLSNVGALLQEWDTAFLEGSERSMIASLASLFPSLDNRSAHIAVPAAPVAVQG